MENSIERSVDKNFASKLLDVFRGMSDGGDNGEGVTKLDTGETEKACETMRELKGMNHGTMNEVAEKNLLKVCRVVT